MSSYKCVVAVGVATLIFCGTVLSQQSSQVVHFNVVVSRPSGQYVTDLKQQDFTLLDNRLAQPITSFRARQIGDELFQYELTFNAPPSAAPREYHNVEVRVDKPNLTVRTRRGYYAQP
jgi:hypothetical protein